MVVHKDVAKTHEEAHDVAIVLPIKEKTKGMVAYSGTLSLP
jgi:hypothetical protein